MLALFLCQAPPYFFETGPLSKFEAGVLCFFNCSFVAIVVGSWLSRHSISPSDPPMVALSFRHNKMSSWALPLVAMVTTTEQHRGSQAHGDSERAVGHRERQETLT